jgi:hypothetical protein
MNTRRDFLKGIAIVIGSLGLSGLVWRQLPIEDLEKTVSKEIMNRFKFHNYLRARSGFERLSLEEFLVQYGRWL